LAYREPARLSSGRHGRARGTAEPVDEQLAEEAPLVGLRGGEADGTWLVQHDSPRCDASQVDTMSSPIASGRPPAVPVQKRYRWIADLLLDMSLIESYFAPETFL